jgi:hydrogenase nickel incorporation protein HypA/HybF
MHELSLAIAIVELVDRHAGGRRVSAVQLSVGALRQVVPSTLEFQFGFASRGSVCEGARLQQEAIAALLRCGECDTEWDPAPSPAERSDDLVISFRCPACRSAGFQVLRGEELDVEAIEVVEGERPRFGNEEEKCTAPR